MTRLLTGSPGAWCGVCEPGCGFRSYGCTVEAPAPARARSPELLMRFSFALLLLPGCFGRPGDDAVKDSETGVADDTGEPVVIAFDATAVQSPQMSTVLRVTWTTELPGTSVVEW